MKNKRQRSEYSCKQCGNKYPAHIEVEIHTHVGLEHPLSREQVETLQKHATKAANDAISEWLRNFVLLTKPQG
jgi:hypothetical protein